MIEFTQGNLFDSHADALVNPVNTVGVMGKGLALQFKKLFPEIMSPYKQACDAGDLIVGSVQTIRLQHLDDLGAPRFVINFPTKQQRRNSSTIEFVQTGLQALKNEIATREIESVAVPPLGCGLGGLAWTDVRSR